MVLEMKTMELVRRGGPGQGTYRGRNRNKEKMGQHNRRRTGNFPRSRRAAIDPAQCWPDQDSERLSLTPDGGGPGADSHQERQLSLESSPSLAPQSLLVLMLCWSCSLPISTYWKDPSTPTFKAKAQEVGGLFYKVYVSKCRT